MQDAFTVSPHSHQWEWVLYESTEKGIQHGGQRWVRGELKATLQEQAGPSENLLYCREAHGGHSAPVLRLHVVGSDLFLP